MTQTAVAKDFTAFNSREEVRAYLDATNNIGRWGPDDQKGTINLIAPKNRRDAAMLVREGVAVSLSRPLATEPGPGNPRPVQHYMRTYSRGGGAGTAHDFMGVACHGASHTHIDALTHVWDVDGKLYNGADPEKEIRSDGAHWGSLDHWSDGIFTRGVLLDVTAHREVPYVTLESPVMAEELEEILMSSGTTLRPGDALVVYSGRERWDEENSIWGSQFERPGLDVSCVKFLRAYDCSVLLWDMTDRRPVGFDLSWGVHAAVPAFGLALVDQARLDDLARVCAELGRNDFLLTINPLVLLGGTGCLVNPVALL
jgi:kynurenine formamidase